MDDPTHGMNPGPIAVFDSGLGGLSVVQHLRQLLPHETIVYFGDTARIPYGTKTRRTIAQFALECAEFLLRFEPKLVVAACNTASALALDELERELPVPCIGVVEPGARAAVQLAGGRPIAVIGTEATIGSDAYRKAIRTLAPEQPVLAKACPLFVPLVEEGRTADDPLVRLAIWDYLAPLREQEPAVLVLGCTHYPLLREAISAYLGPSVAIVDSGRETSLAVQRHLARQAGVAMAGAAAGGALPCAGAGGGGARLSAGAPTGTLRCYVSDNPPRFRQIGERFLHERIGHVEVVEAEQYVGLRPAKL
ncbi:MAG: glutamate racemase [Planctomycetota bacterium]